MTRDKPWRNRPPSTITMAGVTIPREHFHWLADNTDDPTSTRLRRALTNETRLLALEGNECEQILRALTACPEPLAELRAVLLQELVRWQREGL